MPEIHEPLTLPGGQTLPNRIAKAAMEEFLPAAGQVPGEGLVRLYRRWAAGGVGLLVTGHVMVDGRAVADPSDVVLQHGSPLEPFRRWAEAGRSGGGRVWVQLNHPGRVVPADLPGPTWSASAVPVEVGAYSRLYRAPRPLTAEQVQEVVDRFAASAALAEAAGFDGVQIHAAHGYLISQFLSPRTNLREDRWGGSLANRARLLLDVVAAVKAGTSSTTAVSVKLNSADFQRGGFDEHDASAVVGLLAAAGVDLVELSGGSVESMATHGRTADERTPAREAYFLDLAARIAPTAAVPVMLTGGIRRLPVAERVLAGGFAVVGLATALAADPELPGKWLRGTPAETAPTLPRWPVKLPASAGAQAVTRCRMARLAGGAARPGAPGPARALLHELRTRRTALRAYRTWRADRHPDTTVESATMDT